MNDDEKIIQGDLPPNAVPVHGFAVGYGEVAAADEEGVTSLPMVTIMVNHEEDGPMLLFSLEAAMRLTGELADAVPKSIARFDPKFAKTMKHADEVIDRTKRAQRRSERGILLGYLAVLGVVLLVGAAGVAINGGAALRPTGDMLGYIFTILGISYLLKLLAIEVGEWRNRRDRKKPHGE